MTPDLVSVIIPSHGRPQRTQRAINSVAKQTYAPIELLVIDDGSQPPLSDQLNLPNDKLKSARLIRLSENQGANAARNRGIVEASGTFVSFLDSDDILYKEHIEKVVKEFYKKGRGAGGIYTSFDIIEGEHQIDVRLATKALKSPKEVVSGYEMGGFSCLTVRSSVFEKVGLLDEEFAASQDREFMIRILQEYEAYPITERLMAYYYHEEQLSKDASRRIKSMDQLVQKHRSLFEKYGYAHIYYAKGFQYVNMKDIKSANSYFWSSVFEDPTNPLYWYHAITSLSNIHTFKLFNKIKSKVKNGFLVPVKQIINSFI